MHVIPGKFYSYDFVYGQSTLHTGIHLYAFQEKIEDVSQLKNWVLGRKNILEDSQGGIASSTGVITI